MDSDERVGFAKSQSDPSMTPRTKFRAMSRAVSFSSLKTQAANGGKQTEGDESGAMSPSSLIEDDLKWTPDWTLAQFEAKLGRRKQKRGLIFYIVFLILFLFILFDSRDVEGSNLSKSAIDDAIFMEEFEFSSSHVLKNFYKIGDTFEFWEWAEGPLTKALTIDEWYNGDSKPVAVYTYNYQVGAIRFRQLRVKPDACFVDPIYHDISDKCHAQYSSATRDTEPFGPPGNTTKYEWSEDLASDILGRYSAIYDGDGYAFDINKGAGNLTSSIAELKDSLWIDQYTRAVFIHMNFFNPNNFHFFVVTAVVELDPGGFIHPWVQWRAIRLHPYLDLSDYFRMAVEGTFGIVLLVYIVLEFQELRHGVRKYLKDTWNFLDIVNILLFLCAIALYVEYFYSEFREDVTYGDNAFVPLHQISTLYLRVYDVMAFNILLSFLKIFKYLQFNDQMSLLWKTLSKAWPDLRTFIAFFLIILSGFSLFAHLLFGPDLENYRDVVRALATVIQITVGQFNYTEMWHVNRLLAPVFFLLFIILVFFTLVNIFLAILNDAFGYQKKRSRSSERPLDQLIADFLRSIRGKAGRKNRVSTKRIKSILTELVKLKGKEEEMTIEEMKESIYDLCKDESERTRIFAILDQMHMREKRKLEIELEATSSGVLVLGDEGGGGANAQQLSEVENRLNRKIENSLARLGAVVQAAVREVSSKQDKSMSPPVRRDSAVKFGGTQTSKIKGKEAAGPPPSPAPAIPKDQGIGDDDEADAPPPPPPI